MRSPSDKVALAFLAHPDDAEFLCAGTLIRLWRLGWKIHIATATAGDCGTMTRTPEEISSIRREEARQAAALVGGQFHCLGERDGHVTYQPESIQKSVDLFRLISPDLVFTHPRHDYMLDHEQVHLLARMASFLFPCPNASQTIATPGSARIPHLYYCDALGGLDPYTGLSSPVSTMIDISNEHKLKLEMLACHASQRDWLAAHHGMDEYIESAGRHDSAKGLLLGVPFAETFAMHKGHPYPQHDLLAEILR